MRKICIYLISLLCLASSLLADESSPTRIKLHGEELIVTASDGLELHAWLTVTSTKRVPLLILLPMMGHTHRSYDPFMVALFNRFTDSASARSVQKIPNVLSLDLRGHGASTIIAKDTINYRTMEPEDFRPYPSDVAAVIERVLADHSAKIDRNKVMIVGASIGANVSVMAAEMVSDIAKVVMLSPGENYRSLEPAPSIVNYTGKILIIAGSEDAYSKASSEKLAPLNANTTSLKIYSGPQHGTDILDANEQAMADVLDWLLE